MQFIHFSLEARLMGVQISKSKGQIDSMRFNQKSLKSPDQRKTSFRLNHVGHSVDEAFYVYCATSS